MQSMQKKKKRGGNKRTALFSETAITLPLFSSMNQDTKTAVPIYVSWNHEWFMIEYLQGSDLWHMVEAGERDAWDVVVIEGTIKKGKQTQMASVAILRQCYLWNQP